MMREKKNRDSKNGLIIAVDINSKFNSWVKMYTVFTWLNATAAITLVSKIGAATIQSQPPFDTVKRFLNHSSTIDCGHP